nr:secreted trypsin-like serine protease [Kibdelosporangium sp. MJ126-NF4]
MRRFLLLIGALLVLPFLAAPANAGPGPLIVGGRNATEAYSWMVSLQSSPGQHFCTGTLVSPRWVVTANHCLRGHFQVRVGSNSLTSGGQTAGMTTVAVGPDDVGLVQLDRAVTLAPAKIPTTPVAVGTPLRILGWGVTCDPGCQPPQTNQELDTALLADSSCGGITAAGELCMNNPNKTGPCYGDSGGPAVQKVDGAWMVVGATSRAGGPGRCGQSPSVYGDLVAHRDFITTYANG